MATLSEYRMGRTTGGPWLTGERQMMLVSVGTGSAFPVMLRPKSRGEFLLRAAKNLPGRSMRSIAVENDINCRVTGRCVHGREIDREIGDLIPRDTGDPKSRKHIPLDQELGRAFLYARYDPDISTEGLAKAGLEGIRAEKLLMDNVKAMPDMERVGKRAAEEVDMVRDFGPFLPGWQEHPRPVVSTLSA